MAQSTSDTDDANRLLLRIEALYRARKYDDALTKVSKFREKHPDYKASIIGALIDIGSASNNYQLIEDAIEIFEAMIMSEISPQALYNAGNGYQILFERELYSGVNVFDCKDFIDRAVMCFMGVNNRDPRLKTNLANLLDDIGRPIEALLQYDAAISIDHDFGMALGNKALTMGRLSFVSDYQTVDLIYTYQLYQQAFKNKSSIVEIGGPNSLHDFEKDSKYIQSLFIKSGDQKMLEQDLTHPDLNIESESDIQRFYTRYCIEKDLYLNLHIHSNVTNASVGDHIGFHIITDMSDEYSHRQKHVSEVAFRLNEIKEAYISARLSLVQSQYVNDDFSNISEQTLIVNNLDYSVSNIYVGYLKMSFKEAFSVLDKIAILLNYYLELGHKENNPRLSYHSVWFDELDKKKRINDKIKLHQAKLFGLYSVFDEIKKSELDEIRNALTHRYLRVSRTMGSINGFTDYEDLVEKTEALLFKVKCSIIYLHLFINDVESKKNGVNDKKLLKMPINTGQWLDLWK
jgi:tetratricopeptide (TPR) repeat protein